MAQGSQQVGDGPGPVAGRRTLAADLRRLRLATGRTIDDVAGHLGCSPAKVSRMETGAVKVGLSDLRVALELYGVADSERAALFDLARSARTRGWWEEFSDVVPQRSATFFGLEDAAVTIESHCTSLVPGLLQTEAYARALIGSPPDVPARVVRRRVALRMRRRVLLDRPAGPHLHVVLDEAVLHRRIGGAAVMDEQLEHLRAVARRPRVRLQVLEFAAGAHTAAGVGFTVFGFADGPPVVFRELLDANTFLDGAGEVAFYRAAMDEAARRAARPRRSSELVSARIGGW